MPMELENDIKNLDDIFREQLTTFKEASAFVTASLPHECMGNWQQIADIQAACEMRVKKVSTDYLRAISYGAMRIINTRMTDCLNAIMPVRNFMEYAITKEEAKLKSLGESSETNSAEKVCSLMGIKRNKVRCIVPARQDTSNTENSAGDFTGKPVSVDNILEVLGTEERVNRIAEGIRSGSQDQESDDEDATGYTVAEVDGVLWAVNSQQVAQGERSRGVTSGQSPSANGGVLMVLESVRSVAQAVAGVHGQEVPNGNGNFLAISTSMGNAVQVLNRTHDVPEIPWVPIKEDDEGPEETDLLLNENHNKPNNYEVQPRRRNVLFKCFRF